MIICQICHKKLQSINGMHLKTHNISAKEYEILFPNFEVGRKHTQEAKDKISKIKQGHIPWNKGKKGCFSDDVIKRMSEKRKGKKHKLESKIKMSLKRKGVKKSKEHCKNISKGRTGIKFTLEHRKNISKIRIEKKLARGPNNPNWNNGTSYLPYPWKFGRELKIDIRRRDNYQCQNTNCLTTQLESLILWQQELSIHHIDYNKNNCNITNLITLCRNCNSEVNFNRDYWQEYFTDLLHEKFSLRKHFMGDIQ